MRHLVIGGAGFIGSRLVEMLTQRDPDNKIMVVDDMRGSYHPDRESIFDLKRVKVEIADIREWTGNDVNYFDRIYFLADSRDEMKAHETMMFGLRNALKLTLACGARMVYGSSLDIYDRHPSLVRESRRTAEMLCMAYQERGVSVSIARIHNVYGPKAFNPGKFVDFITALRECGEFINLVYVDDVVEGLIKLIERDARDYVDLCYPTMFSRQDIIEAFHQGYYKKEVDAIPEPIFARAVKMLGWHPQVSISEGLTRTREWVEGCARRESALKGLSGVPLI